MGEERLERSLFLQEHGANSSYSMAAMGFGDSLWVMLLSWRGCTVQAAEWPAQGTSSRLSLPAAMPFAQVPILITAQGLLAGTRA